jgi:hypothetical protein
MQLPEACLGDFKDSESVSHAQVAEEGYAAEIQSAQFCRSPQLECACRQTLPEPSTYVHITHSKYTSAIEIAISVCISVQRLSRAPAFQAHGLPQNISIHAREILRYKSKKTVARGGTTRSVIHYGYLGAIQFSWLDNKPCALRIWPCGKHGVSLGRWETKQCTYS